MTRARFGWLSSLMGSVMMAGAISAMAGVEMPPDAREGRHVFHDFAFRSGEVLPELTVGYTLLGEPCRNASGQITNAVLLLHGTTGSARNWFLPGLARHLYGPGQPLDRYRYFLIIPDGIGMGRSSKPSDGLRARFPHYGYHDMVTATYRLLSEGLQVNHLRAVIGTSMGGMQTWLFAERYPGFMDGAIAIASSPTVVSGRNMMWRQILIESIRGAPDWSNGEYTEQPESFRRVWPLFGTITDSAIHLQSQAPTRAGAIEAYRALESAATLLDANDILYRFEASADYQPEAELEAIRVPFLAINFQDDLLNPVELEALQHGMARVRLGRFALLPASGNSVGHQNLGQGDRWGPIASEFLEHLPSVP